MTLNAANVVTGAAGQVLVGATTATAPSGTTGTLTGFNDLGYMSDDGLTEARSRDTNDITAWQNGSVVKTAVTSAGLTLQFTMIETKKETIELYYGTTVTQTSTNGTFDVDPSSTGGRHSFIIDEIDTDGDITRRYIPSGEVTEVDDRTNQNGEVVGYTVTITAYPSSTIGNKPMRVWSEKLASVA